MARAQRCRELEAELGDRVLVRIAWFKAITEVFVDRVFERRTEVNRAREQQMEEREDLESLVRMRMRLAGTIADLERDTARYRARAAEFLRVRELRLLQMRELLRADAELAAQLGRRHAELEVAPERRTIREELEQARRLARTELSELQALRSSCFCGQPAEFIAFGCGHMGCRLHAAMPCPCGQGWSWHRLY